LSYCLWLCLFKEPANASPPISVSPSPDDDGDMDWALNWAHEVWAEQQAKEELARQCWAEQWADELNKEFFSTPAGPPPDHVRFPDAWSG
jgi:hypothetical protein